MLNYHSPAYEIVRNQFNNNLPHARTIKAWFGVSDMNSDPGINSESLNRLKGFVDKLKIEKGEQLVCSLIFDEMSIRQQMIWDENKMEYLGFITYGMKDTNDTNQGEIKKIPIAKKSIIFMLFGINKYFQFPVGYHFVDALNSDDLAQLLKEVITKITECGARVANLVFDGAKTNLAMCKLLGANLDISVQNFKPYIENPYDHSIIYLILDPSHMEKLMRNLLGNHKVLFDGDGNKVEWRYFVDLLNISQNSNGLTILKTHKLTRKHIEFGRNIMNVRLAAETFSNSVGDSMKMLKDQGNKKFANSEATIKFVYKMNRLFDIFNSMGLHNSDIFKNALSEKNKQQIFTFAEDCKKYLKNLKTLRNGKKVNVFNTINFTPILGFFMDLTNLPLIYAQYVENEKSTKCIYTYCLSQDHLEIFHAKLRSRNGNNNNPNVAQFKGAYRRLVCNLEIKSPQASNCMAFQLFDSQALTAQSNVYFVSSRRPKLDIINDENFQRNLSNQTAEILEEFGQPEDLSTLNDMEKCSHLTDGMSNASIAYAARMIEIKIEKEIFYCDCCKLVFGENEKLNDHTIYVIESKRPCVSTFYICKIVDRFMRIHKPKFLSNDHSDHSDYSERDFRVLYYMIFQEIDFDNVYTESNFKDHEQHKFHLIKCIVQQYIRLKTSQISKQFTFSQYDKFLRSKLTRWINFAGQ